MDLKSKNPQGGRPIRIYLLNELQATLINLLTACATSCLYAFKQIDILDNDRLHLECKC